MANKKNENEVVVKIEGESWKKALDKAFAEKVKKVNVAGFRKGKVPRDIYEKKFGKESLYFPASDYVISEAYEKAIKDSKLVPVVQPKIEIKDVNDEAIEFVFKIITKPEVKIKKYKGLSVKPEKVKVTKEEVETEVERMLEKYSEVRTKEKGALKEGEIAIIDFEGFKDGTPFEGGKAENYELEIGSHTFIPGFEEQLVGMKTEEEKEINVTFPKDYPVEDLKDKEVTFKVKLHEIIEAKHKVDKLGGTVVTKKMVDKIDQKLAKVGDDVYIKSYDQYGVIERITKDGMYEVAIGNMSLKLNRDDFNVVDKVAYSNQQKSEIGYTKSRASISLTLDLRGKRYEEAKDLLDKYIDDLMASGIKQANIIHGYGTGVIRELVQSYLKNNKNISSYRYGGENEGGFGVTVVTLK